MPVIATNTSANSALTYLNRNSEDQAKSLSKLPSGSRIVVASDDAAGLAVADAGVDQHGVVRRAHGAARQAPER